MGTSPVIKIAIFMFLNTGGQNWPSNEIVWVKVNILNHIQKPVCLHLQPILSKAQKQYFNVQLLHLHISVPLICIITIPQF